MSKNASPTMGMDVEGLTALIRSVTRIDSALFPGDFPLDVMVHPATAQGEEGLAAMRTLVRTYMEKHGIAIHFNIFDADTLVAAQEHPDQYQGLQLRVCGWNVNFTELSRREQDMYIRRARNICE
jgi:formate C-acetyltransferase